MNREWLNWRLVAVGVTLVVFATAAIVFRAVTRPSNVSALPSADTSADAEMSSTPSIPGSPAATAGPSSSPSPKKANPVVPAGFPTPENTGWRHTGVKKLKVITEPYFAYEPGAVLDSMDFQAGLWIRVDNVTVKRSRVSCDNMVSCFGLWVTDRNNILIEDVEITSKSKDIRIDRAFTGDGSTNLTIRRLYVHDTQKGLSFGRSTLIEDSYIDDEYNPSESHVSAIGGDTTANMKLVIRHNWVAGKPRNNNSAALLYYPPQVNYHPTPNLNILIENNVINGGSYGMWLSSDPYFTGTLVVRNNLFGTKYFDGCGQYGSHFIDDLAKPANKLAVTWQNNTWYSPGNRKHGQELSFVPPAP